MSLVATSGCLSDQTCSFSQRCTTGSGYDYCEKEEIGTAAIHDDCGTGNVCVQLTDQNITCQPSNVRPCAAQRLPFGPDHGRIVLNDVTGDGYPDLLFMSGGLWMSAGPTLGPPTSLWSPPASGTLEDFAVADLDGDGHPEIVTSYSTAGGYAVAVLRGVPPNAVVFSQTVHAAQWVGIGDFDGDGALDIIGYRYASPQDDVSFVLEPFGARTVVDAAVSLDLCGAAVIDRSGDGRSELITLPFEKIATIGVDNTGSVKRNNAVRGAILGFECIWEPGSFRLVAANFDADPLQDLAVVPIVNAVNPSLAAVEVLHNRGGDLNTVPTKSYGYALSEGLSVQPIAVADVNGDGKNDLIVVDSKAILAFELGNGDGTFAEPSAFRPEPVVSLVSVAAADLNLDGALQVVASVGGAQGLVLFPSSCR